MAGIMMTILVPSMEFIELQLLAEFHLLLLESMESRNKLIFIYNNFKGAVPLNIYHLFDLL